MNLLELPDCVLDEIFLYLSYDEIAKKRLVSTRINKICQSLLNRGAVKLLSRLDNKIEKLKPLLPRKHSKRWDHPANVKTRYLETIGIQVRSLFWKYEDYIDDNLCCFIPGKVIDLSLSILKRKPYPEKWSEWPIDNNYEELEEAASMAEEHFEEQIEPTLQLCYTSDETSSSDEEEPENREQVEPSIQKAVESPVAIPMAIQQNSNKCIVTNKKYAALLRNVNLNSKAIKKQLTNSRKRVADLRRRLKKCQSQNRSATGEQTGSNHLVTKTDNEALRLRKRLADDGATQKRSVNGTRKRTNKTRFKL